MMTVHSDYDDALLYLSIVIIARNEGNNIARSIESVLKAVEKWPRTEILLVDSASTDGTVEIAKRYPISIVRIPSSWFLSVAAGRHIGMHNTHGELVLHLDGDMELDQEWIDRSVPYALTHPEVAVVGGFRRDIFISNGQIIGEEDVRHDSLGRILEVNSVCGVMLCRRSALQHVGGFQPFIRGEEDIDLCMDLRYAGYKIIRLPYLTCRHYCIHDKSFSGIIRRVKLNMWLGFGQVLRYHLGTPLFWNYLRLNLALVLYSFGILLSICTVFLIFVTKNNIYLGCYLVLILGLLVVLSIKKRSLNKALLSVFTQTMIAYSALRGFFMRPHTSEEYPTDVEIVQVSPIL